MNKNKDVDTLNRHEKMVVAKNIIVDNLRKNELTKINRF